MKLQITQKTVADFGLLLVVAIVGGYLIYILSRIANLLEVIVKCW